MTTDKIRISSFEEAADFFKDNVDAMIVTDSENNTIKPLVKRGIFRDFIDDNWQYTDLIQQLWYHFSNSSEKIVEDYQVFLPKSGDFVGKYSKRTNLMIDDIIHVV
ncbi:MAG: hypothetical protein ILP19_08280 [Oscillospiraceae bacterium]|nr:hypothetical protein [Oscillospiraceae bacterium]